MIFIVWGIIALLFTFATMPLSCNGVSRVDSTDGLLDSHYAKSLPQGYVVYADGNRSITMPIGNARSYAKIFGGYVVAVNHV